MEGKNISLVIFTFIFVNLLLWISLFGWLKLIFKLGWWVANALKW
jgi:hypothetical protein